MSADSPQLATMVDVSEKAVTKRTAAAVCRVNVPKIIVDELFGGDELLLNGDTSGGALSTSARNDFYTKKGPVLNTAVVAGTMAAKNTANLIPFCHPLPIESCTITFAWSEPVPSSSSASGARVLEVTCQVATSHKTGIEMEAMSGASVAGLCVYDMLKGCVLGAQQQDGGALPLMLLETKLLHKTGGKSDIDNHHPSHD